jgi:linoleoyl-CoA desaturase
MAITDLKRTHPLTAADVEGSRGTDAIRTDIEESRGERDARYIRCSIQLQRALPPGRIALFASGIRWPGCRHRHARDSEIIENMELSRQHHPRPMGRMNDPEIHSTEWEWDTTSPGALEEVATSSTTNTRTSSGLTTSATASALTRINVGRGG